MRIERGEEEEISGERFFEKSCDSKINKIFLEKENF